MYKNDKGGCKRPRMMLQIILAIKKLVLWTLVEKKKKYKDSNRRSVENDFLANRVIDL